MNINDKKTKVKKVSIQNPKIENIVIKKEKPIEKEEPISDDDDEEEEEEEEDKDDSLIKFFNQYELLLMKTIKINIIDMETKMHQLKLLYQQVGIIHKYYATEDPKYYDILENILDGKTTNTL